jgi:hypothetical protein
VRSVVRRSKIDFMLLLLSLSSLITCSHFQNGPATLLERPAGLVRAQSVSEHRDDVALTLGLETK